MSPSYIVALIVAAGAVGGVFYSYHIGREQGDQICRNEKLEAELIKKENELAQEKALTEFQQEQIGEAQSALEDQRNKINALEKDLNNASSGQSYCIPDSVLQKLREFRYGAKYKNS